ncbi:MAG: sporulation integral membrane protein YtvI [Oscillospiraceae bacterium]|nr:sporulation integral membrane protein YtvI [Oscillospiraceae bacterium]
MKKTWNIFLYVFAGAAGIWFCARLLLPVGLPFLLGFLISCLSRPLKPKRWNQVCSGVFSVSLVFLMLSMVLWILGKSLFAEIERWTKMLPDILQETSPSMDQISTRFLRLADRLPPPLSSATRDWLRKLFDNSSVLFRSASERLFSFAAKLLGMLPDLLLFILTALLSAYFFSVEDQQLRQWFRENIPSSLQEKFLPLYKKLCHALGGYIKAQVYLSAVSFGLSALGLLILGYKKAFLIALTIGLVDALPVLGAGAILIPWSLLCFLRGVPGGGSALLALYAIVSIVRTVLEPKLLGSQIGLPPLLTLLGLYGGYRLFGVVGMLLLPIGFLLIRQVYELSRDF